MSTCRRCGTLIDWVQTPDGKWIPLDPEPVLVIENGGTDRFLPDDGQEIIGRRARLEERSLRTPAAFVPHWKTCVGVGRYRRQL